MNDIEVIFLQFVSYYHSRQFQLPFLLLDYASSQKKRFYTYCSLALINYTIFSPFILANLVCPDDTLRIKDESIDSSERLYPMDL